MISSKPGYSIRRMGEIDVQRKIWISFESELIHCRSKLKVSNLCDLMTIFLYFHLFPAFLSGKTCLLFTGKIPTCNEALQMSHHLNNQFVKVETTLFLWKCSRWKIWHCLNIARLHCCNDWLKLLNENATRPYPFHWMVAMKFHRFDFQNISFLSNGISLRKLLEMFTINNYDVIASYNLYVTRSIFTRP